MNHLGLRLVSESGALRELHRHRDRRPGAKALAVANDDEGDDGKESSNGAENGRGDGRAEIVILMEGEKVSRLGRG